MIRNSLLSPTVQNGIAAARTWLRGLSARERSIVSAAVVVSLFLAVYTAGEWLYLQFSAQTQMSVKLQENYRSVLALSERYARLDKRRQDIEARYRKFAVKEGAISYLEGLVKDKGQIPPGRFKITSVKEREIGGGYVQSPVRIRLDSVTDFPALVNLLREIAEGSQPMILTELDIQKNLVQNVLTVEMEISSIRQAEGSPR